MPQKILGMQEQHRLAVRADLRVAVAKHARALRLQLVAGGDDVIDLVADVMNAAVGILFDELGDRRILAERLEKFDLGVGQLDKHDRHAMLGLRQRLRHLGAQRIAVDGRRLGEVLDRNRNMIEASDHSSVSVISASSAKRLDLPPT